MNSIQHFFKKLKYKFNTLTKEQKVTIRDVVIIVALLAATLLFVPFLKLVLNTHYPLVVVTSGSMEPNIYRGDLLVIGNKDPEDIKNGTHENEEGDIILYDANDWSNNGIYSHTFICSD